MRGEGIRRRWSVCLLGSGCLWCWKEALLETGDRGRKGRGGRERKGPRGPGEPRESESVVPLQDNECFCEVAVLSFLDGVESVKEGCVGEVESEERLKSEEDL